MELRAYISVAWIFNIVVQRCAHAAIAMNAEEPVAHLIQQYGYPLEIYNDVKTADGYLLSIYRIPHGRSATLVQVRTPVLLVHGLFGDAGDFIDLGPDRGLGFLLAERFYDVWLVNSRGTRPSRKHVRLNPDTDSRFWQFSWHEIGLYDLPVIFDLIKNVTGQQKLIYIGSSQGSAAFFVLASECPTINDRVSLMIGLAPVAFTKNFHNPILQGLAGLEPIWTQLAQTLGIHELLPEPFATAIQVSISNICSMNLLQEICAGVVSLVGGMGSTQLDKGVLSSVVLNSVSPIATRQILHFAQLVNSGVFRKYDFGPRENIRQYGSKTPPVYNISRITAPVAVYYSQNDWLSNHKDVENLCIQLPNCVYKYKVPDKGFNHFDFMLAVDLVKLVFNDLFRFLNEYNKSHT